MVEFISLVIPRSMGMDDPAQDAAFMDRIGAKSTVLDWVEVYAAYEIKNAVTGTRFTFAWHKCWDHLYWTLSLSEIMNRCSGR